MGIVDVHITTTEPAQKFQDKLFLLLNSNFTKMAKEIDDIKASNAQIKSAIANIAGDIAALDAKIQAAATPEELAAIKGESADLAASAQTLADTHPDTPGTGGGGTVPPTGGTEPGVV